jgi:hypothetical protein
MDEPRAVSTVRASSRASVMGFGASTILTFHARVRVLHGSFTVSLAATSSQHAHERAHLIEKELPIPHPILRQRTIVDGQPPV